MEFTPPTEELQEIPSTKSEIEGLFREFTEHLTDLGELAAIESREAFQSALQKYVSAVILVFFASFFYLLFLVGLIGILYYQGFAWHWSALSFAALHLIGAVASYLFFRNKQIPKLFAETLQQVRLTQQCLISVLPKKNN